MKKTRVCNKFMYPLLIFLVVMVVTSVSLVFLAKNKNDVLLAQNLELENQNQSLKDEIMDKSLLGGIEEYGRLSVRGTQLVDQNGNPVVLRGLSSHGLTWYPEYTNYRALKTLKEYGVNVFRIAMYVGQNDGYLEEPKLNKKLLYSAIENSLEADLYTIVDWHVLRDKDPNKNIDEAVDFFEEVARRYGDNKGIIYEICNEPNGDTSYKDIEKYAKKIIPVIRKYAPNAIILVGTPNFCTSLSDVIKNPINYHNVMYTYHYYAGVSDCKFAIDEITRGIESGIPVFVSEWGLDSKKDSDTHWEETTNFLDFLDSKNISWVNWSFSNKDEGYSFIKSNVDSLHSWNINQLTDIGRYVLERIKSK